MGSLQLAVASAPRHPHLPRMAGEPLEIAACTRSSSRPRLQWEREGAALEEGPCGCRLCCNMCTKIYRTVG